MIIKNSTSTKRSNQAKDKEQIKYSYKESFKRENKSLLNDSELIKNYNDSQITSIKETIQNNRG